MKRKLIQLANDRTAALDAAKAAFEAGNQAEYDSQMEKVTNLNDEIQKVQNFLHEQERQVLENVPTGAEARDMAEERGSQLMRGEAVSFSPVEVRRALNSVTIGGTLVQPTGADSEIHGEGAAISSILDMVSVEDLTGLGQYEVPYLITELGAQVGKIDTNSGVARTGSTDPTFGIAQIKPYEATVTAYVDRNIAKLTPARYYEKVQAQALRALRKKVVGLIVNGDSENTHVFQGIKNATNKAGTAIVQAETYTAIDVNTLDNIYFAYGADTELGGTTTLFLTKAELKAIGALRGTNEKGRLFKITPSGNGNTGVIADGGLVVPYVLVSDLAADAMIYGNPLTFLLGLFGGYEIRIDESVKSIERMHTILGDVAVGGNIIEHHGLEYITKAAAGTT